MYSLLQALACSFASRDEVKNDPLYGEVSVKELCDTARELNDWGREHRKHFALVWQQAQNLFDRIAFLQRKARGHGYDTHLAEFNRIVQELLFKVNGRVAAGDNMLEHELNILPDDGSSDDDGRRRELCEKAKRELREKEQEEQELRQKAKRAKKRANKSKAR